MNNKNLIDYFIFLEKFINKNVNNQKVLHAIGELINEKQKDFIRKNFKEELLRYLDFYLKNL